MSASIQRLSISTVARFLFVVVLLGTALLPAVNQAKAWTIPTINIVSVDAQDTVTIQPVNWPANQVFTVRMGYYGTLGIGGIVVGTIASGAGGTLPAQTFTIPAELKGQYMIAIRTDSSTGYYYSYNWFYNIDSGAQPAGYVPPSGSAPTPSLPTALPGALPTAMPNPYYYPYWGVVPTFSIVAVVRDTSVTILTNNFPPYQEFTVRMNEYGTLGYGGVVVGTIPAGSGGSFEATFPIPAYFAGRYQIAIRADSPQGYYAYNWFYNNTTY